MLTKVGLKVAVVHDWLNGLRGGELVLDAVLELFPEAELFTLFYEPGRLNPRIENRKIHVSFLNSVPGARRNYRYFLPFFPLAIERFDLKDFDLVISTSHCVAKGIIPGPTTTHVCYCFTPMRYAWDSYESYFGKSRLQPVLFPVLHYLRLWDVASSHRVDAFVTLSQYVAGRIRHYYRRDSEVVYPFADLTRYALGRGDRGDYYLAASAFAPYKRIDLAISACERLGRKLIVVGTGQAESDLRKMAGPHTVFRGRVSDAELAELYQGARALLFPGEEDFGIVPVEAMASGCPVIAYGRGGATETVIEGKTGLFFHQATAESLIAAIENFEKQVWSPEVCRRQAEFFSRNRFQTGLMSAVERALAANKQKSPNRYVPQSNLEDR